jgi:probable HAF family extracellular repeat protein
MKRTLFHAATLATFLFAVFGSAPALAQPQIIHIGAGHPYSLAEAINDRGQVVGVMNFPEDEGRFHAYVSEEGGLRDLNPGGFGQAYDINDRGQIVGVADLGDGVGDSVLWDDGAPPVRLETPAGARCLPLRINAHGLVVGWCLFASDSGPVIWRHGVFERMAVPPGVDAFPSGLNDRGVVVGNASRTDGSRFPFVWADGVLIDLNTISDRPFERVVAINKHGQIAGEGPRPDGRSQGLLWQAGRTLVIPPLPGATAAIPYGLNDRGQVVGASAACGFVWDDAGSRALSCLPGGHVAYGTAINERGDIAGHAVAPPDNFLPNAVLWPGAGKHPPRRVDR